VEAAQILWKWYCEGDNHKRADAIHAMAAALREYDAGREGPPLKMPEAGPCVHGLYDCGPCDWDHGRERKVRQA